MTSLGISTAASQLICFFYNQLKNQIQSLQAQLAQRPPVEVVQELQKEYTNLDILLQGTQRENERCMTELERYVVRVRYRASC